MHRWCSVTEIFSRFGEQLHHLIYPNKLEVMILLIFESLLLVITVTFILILTTEEDEKKQQTRWLPIVNFPLNIPAAPVFDVYISQLILYSSGYAQWSDFQWDQLPTQDLLKQTYVAIMLNSPLQTFHGCHHELAAHCELSIFQMPIDVFTST